MSAISYEELQNFNEGLVSIQQQNALRRYTENANEREHLAHELESKSPLEVDTPQRTAVRKALIDPRDGLAMERILGKNDLFPISYLEAGLKASKPVCRIELRDSIGRVLGHGTGFLVSPSLLLTNSHVLADENIARFSLAQFNYEVDLNLMQRESKSFRFEPERFFITDTKLDFTLVAVEESSASGTKLSEFGFLPLLANSGKALIGEYVSIIQHPSGAPKAVAIRENQITDIIGDYIHYSTDTMPGSSGSPVYNDEWITIALHHSSVPDPKDSTKYIANEGIRISSIVKFITQQNADLSRDKNVLLNELLDGSLKVSEKPCHQTKNMPTEELNLEWYENSTGYNPLFLGTAYPVPLPKLRTDLEQDAVSIKAGGYVLNYTHFSIVMSKSRCLAYYAAANIDGNQLVDIIRNKDKWYFDPRIDRKYQYGPELYADNELDKGHLVRRRDPAWGESARKANEDTFHFTNCSPQHRKLNQKTWLELEDYILKNADQSNIKVTVFTGPVFRNDDMFYREKYQIPAEFWKVAVMIKDTGNVSATAYLQTQKNFIKDLEFAYGEYKTYQVPISRIEALTGLDFGDLRKHDPISYRESIIDHVIKAPQDIIF